MLRELSRLGSKRMPPVEAEAEEESRPSSPKKSGLSGRLEESGDNDGADDVKDMKNFDLSRLVLISAWKKGIYTALPGVLVITSQALVGCHRGFVHVIIITDIIITGKLIK